MRSALYIAIGAVLVILAYTALVASIDRSARAECIKWSAEAVAFAPVFYLTQAEEDQCQAVGVEVIAPVR